MSNFAPHGLFESCVRGRVLIVKCTGAWNLETLQEYAQETYQKTSGLVGRPFAMLNDINDWELATKDCEPLLIKMVDAAIEQGLCREAVINSQGVIKIEQFNLSLTDRAGFKRKFFKDEMTALKWLEDEGFSTKQ